MVSISCSSCETFFSVWHSALMIFSRMGVDSSRNSSAAEEKTSSVHFMRIELSPAMASAAKAGAAIRMGIDHPNYQGDVILSDDSRHSLVSDLE